MAETTLDEGQAEETVTPDAYGDALGEGTTGTDLVSQMEGAPLIERISAANLAILRSHSAKNLNDAEINTLLAMGVATGLDPRLGQIYAAKGEGANSKLLIMVGRDGLLRKAEEFPDYMGYEAAVVHENDDFWRGDPDPDAKTMRGRAGVTHRTGLPRDRGAIVGAWAVAERRGRPVRYFFADIKEYMPAGDKFSPWKKQTSVMIEKVPISVVHRTLINLSGVYLEEEAASMLAGPDRTPQAPILGAEEEATLIGTLIYDLDAPEPFKTELFQTISEINELSPGAWSLSACQMKLPGQSSQVLRQQLIDAKFDLAELQKGAPSTATRESEPIADAQVVD